MEQIIKWFEEARIGASVLLFGKEDYLKVGEHGVLAIPAGIKPAGFHLVLYYLAGAQVVIAQKNVGLEQGDYHRYALSQLGISNDLVTWAMHDPIEVKCAGTNVWTSWRSTKPNRLDCWIVEKNGHLDLFQVGMITHDNGKTFRLLGEYRWRGQLFVQLFQDQRLVGKPDHPKWGNFDVRRQILDDPDIQKLLHETFIPAWTGKTEELDPPLNPVPGPGFARMQWYIPFAGQTGQGPAVLHDGSTAWVHGVDIQEPPDPDGIKRLKRNSLVSFTGVQKNWGAKKDGPPKLLNVTKVREDQAQ